MSVDVANLILGALNSSPGTDLQATANALRETIEADGQGAHFEDLWGRTLTVRAQFGQSERREQALAALFQSAHDMTRLREPEAVLRSIVHRGRELMQIDCVWMMSLDDTDNMLRMRVTDGITSPKFEALEVAVGEGVAGAVAKSGVARWSKDFREDSRFARPEAATAATADEGIRAILGAPLAVDDRVMGVLLAGHRAERDFSPDEVDVFVSLAAHAAVVLENARLFASVNEKIAQVSETQLALEDVNAAQVAAASAQEQLLEVAVQGAGLQDVIDTICEIVGESVALTDDAGRILYDDGAVEREDSWRDIVSSMASRVSELGLRAKDVRPSHQVVSFKDSKWFHAVGLWNENESIGYLVIETEHDISDAQRRLLGWSSLVAALVLVGIRSTGDFDRENRSSLLLELVTAGFSGRSRLMASSLTFNLSGPASLCVVEATAEMCHARVYRAARKYATALGGLATSLDEYVVLSLPASPRAFTHLSERLTEAADEELVIGSARVELDHKDGYKRAFERAKRCQQVLTSLGVGGRVVDIEELSPYAMLLGSLDAAAIATFLEKTVGPVQEYDRKYGTPLLETLDSVFQAGGQVSAAAKHLYIHTNTVYQRLSRIDALSGCQWRSNETAMQWQLALALRRLKLNERD